MTIGPSPTVSVLMPARNAARTIGEALRSILTQTGVVEVIIVDDLSTDCTREVIATIGDSRIIVVEGEGRGIARALNLAIEKAYGEFVARCDADDRYPAGRIARQSAYLSCHDDFAAVSGGFCSISKQGQLITNLACDGLPRDITDNLLAGAAVTHLCTFLIRRQVLLELGGAREWFTTAEDLDLMFRLAALGRIWHDPRVSYDYRVHDTSIVHRQSDVQRLFYEQAAIDFALERHARGSDALERGEPPKVPDNIGKKSKAAPQISGYLESAAWSAFRDGHRGDALRLMIRALASSPLRLSAWRSIALLATRRSFSIRKGHLNRPS